MSIKNYIRIVLGLLLFYSIFVYPIKEIWNMPSEKKFTVIEKFNKNAIKSTGKYNSEVVSRDYVRIRYENGEEQTLTFDDPFISSKYIVGNVYIENLGLMDKVNSKISVTFSFFIMICLCFSYIVMCSSIYIFSDSTFKYAFFEGWLKQND